MRADEKMTFYSSFRPLLRRSHFRAFSSSAILRREQKLYSQLDLEFRAHQPAVLKSYGYFVNEAAKHMDVAITEDVTEETPHRTIKTLLKSAFVHKKHRVQYEFRTYYRLLTLDKMTESTKDTFLEYIQRNLPEGVAMKVTTTELQKLPPKVSEAIT